MISCAVLRDSATVAIVLSGVLLLAPVARAQSVAVLTGRDGVPTPERPSQVRTDLASLDGDGDGLNDAWETTFGLNPTDAADALLDADGDGASNAEEFLAGTHPNGAPVRYFAEGASNAFFSTSLGLFNPGDIPVVANVRFLGPDGASRSVPVSVAAGAPATLDVDNAGLPFGEFSMIVESPVPLAAERRMTWQPTGIYGSHSGTGVAAPATVWHFAEGATTAGIHTFFLLENPTLTPATVTMRYLLPTGPAVERTHVVPAQSRITIWCNQEGAPLDAAEFAATILADVPVVAERATYRDAPGEVFAAGSVASGVAVPATSWSFAEGATGEFFDTYLLLANPGDTPATVSARYPRARGVNDQSAPLPFERTYVVAPRSRLTIWVAQEAPELRQAEFSAMLTADVPIVAERAMWWPGPTAASWREVHADTGTSGGGRLWAVADIQVDLAAGGWDTFLLIATTEQYLARARISIACDDGTRVTRDRALEFNRTTIWLRHEFPELADRRCGALVESLPTKITLSPAVPLYRTPLVVEKAMYFGADFAAGSASLATRLPDPED